MKKTYIVCVALVNINPVFANTHTTCRNIGGFVHCDTMDSVSAPTINYGAGWGDSFLSGFNSGMQARKNAIETQNALIQQQILLQQQAQQAAAAQNQVASCKIDKIVGKAFSVGKIELVLTYVESNKYKIDGTESYILTKDCFRYMEHQKVIADISYSESDKIYFE